MDRWKGVLRVCLNPKSGTHFRVAASLLLSPTYETLATPPVNAIFFGGDRVQGTGNRVIEKLSDMQNIAEILISKLGVYVNAWVVEASVFNGPFAIYEEFVPSVNSRGEPKSYKPDGFPASTSILLLLSKCLQQVKYEVSTPDFMHFILAKTILIGFSKGGIVLNQVSTELSCSTSRPEVAKIYDRVLQLTNVQEPIEEKQTFPILINRFLDSISEIHYVDVGLNGPGAYLTDQSVVRNLVESLDTEDRRIRFILHGTPRQWNDRDRPWIRQEKDRMLRVLQSEIQGTQSRLQVCERFYFHNMPPSIQMHFQIIEELDMS